MRIESSAIQISSGHSLQSRYQRSESSRFWVNPLTPRKAAVLPFSCHPRKENVAPQKTEGSEISNPRLFLIKKIIEALTGKEIPEIRADFIHDTPASACPTLAESSPRSSPESERMGWGIDYHMHESYAETETTMILAAGTVRTADGRQIRFQMDFRMSRSYTQDTAVSLRAGDALTDPLIIHLTPTTSPLTDARFEFDLNGDGKDEGVPLPAGGSAFLVYDRNGDRQVNNGTELFGPCSGNGFAELSLLDETGDGWIDENDPAYGSLYAWYPGDGPGICSRLQDEGIGAITTQAVGSVFSLRDGSNSTLGQIQRSGLFLTESGQPGLIQQLDMVA